MIVGFWNASRASALVVALAVALGGPFVARATPSFTGLGFLDASYPYSEGFALSADGSVVVGTSLSGGHFEAFRWTAVDGITGLGGIDSIALGVSGDGSVVVGQVDPPGQSTQEAFRWTAADGMVALGSIDPNNTYAFSASGVSSDGSVVVGASVSPSGTEAFRWTTVDGIVGLGSLEPNSTSAAWGVSADGSVVVGQSGSEAFRWTVVDGMLGLGSLPNLPRSRAFGVSADGSAVVGTSESLFGQQAFRWTEVDGMVGLGFLDASYPYSEGRSTSADGSVVVGGSGEAFRWTTADGMQSLADVLTSFGLNLTGWSLDHATGVSANGLTFVGTGHHNGLVEAWIAQIPEPSTWPLLAAATSALLVLRNRRRGR